MSVLSQAFNQTSQNGRDIKAPEVSTEQMATWLKTDDIQAIREAVESGMDLPRHIYRGPVINFAAQHDAADAIQYLVNVQGMDKDSYYYAAADYERCNSALMDAVENNNFKAAKTLIDLGANIHYESDHYRNAYMSCAETNSPEMLDLIMSHGGTEPSKYGCTAKVKFKLLETAIAKNNGDRIIPHIIKTHDLDINAPYQHEGSLGHNPVIWAMEEEYDQSLLALLRTNKVDLSIKNGRGHTLESCIENHESEKMRNVWKTYQEELFQQTKRTQNALHGHKNGIKLRRRGRTTPIRTSLSNRKKFGF